MDPVTEMFVSPIVSGLITYLAPLISSLLPSGGIGSKLQEMTDTLEAIQALLNDAESSQLTKNLIQPWLREVQKLASEIEDLVDELETEDRCRKMIAAPESSSSSKVGKFFSKVNPKAIGFNVKMDRKIRKISDRLQQLEKKKNPLNLQRFDGGISVRTGDVMLPSTSLLPADEIYGRKEDADAILKWLLKDRTCNHDGKLCIFSIVGMGGIGKTTLAQSLYNDKQVKEFFQDRAWVCVTEEFDVFKISKIIYEEVFKMSCNFSDLNMIQVQLKEKLSNKKFLIVLDDLWNDKEYTQWDLLCTPFRAGTNGSTIIVTTRNQGVANLVCSDVVHELKELSDGDCLSLLAKHAFQRLNFDEHQEFRKVGEVIAERCKGLPLAAKSLGGLLRTKRGLQQLEEVSTSKIWKLEGDNIIPALRLSYHHLPPYLKPLFAYCSLFPKGYEFSKHDLILLWMAQGFLRRESGGDEKTMEKQGYEYFNELLSRSFFQNSTRDESKFVMHDLNNDLAQFVAGPTYLSLDNKLTSNEQYKVSEVARHASFTATNFNDSRNFKSFDEARGLWTLLPIQASSQDTSYLRNRVVKELLPRLQCLRVLSFSGYLLNELPNTIGDLKHLRYLNLSRSRITKLPESICDLYNLQTLLLYNCQSLVQLPSNLQKLINLDIESTPRLQEMPSGISMLTGLRTLQKFFVGKNTGWKINELKHLHHLQGTLSLIGMENVTNAQDAIDSDLLRKKGIHGLKMKWNNISGDSGLEFKVLEALKPHIGLRSLEVEFYGGLKFPDWIGDRVFNDMVEVRLLHCRNCENLPPLGHLTSLKKLFIQGMDKVKAVGTEFFGSGSPSYVAFQSLIKLSFIGMGSWEEWSADLTNEAFPRLEEVEMSGCMKLDKVSLERISFSSLELLQIRSCSEMVLRCMVGGGSVKRFLVEDILMLSKIDDKMIRCLGEVEELRVSRCDQLRYLWEEGVACQVLHKLEVLDVRYCEQLECLGDEEQLLPHNIESLTLVFCEKLEKIPNWKNSLISLGKLNIYNCKKFDGMLASTTDLKPKSRNNTVQSSSGGNHGQSNLGEVTLEERGGMNRMPLAFLKWLRLTKWPNLKSLPQGFAYLTHLRIAGCSGIESISETSLPSTLIYIAIYYCKNLKNINCTNKMQSLTSLRDLKISTCNNLENYPSEGCWPPNLKYLQMGDVKQPITEWGLATLPASLSHLRFVGKLPELVSFSEVWTQLSTTTTTTTTSLTRLTIRGLENLEWLGEGLENLSSLQHLRVDDCPKFGRFPKTLSPKLSTFFISRCPIVKERFMKKKRDYLSKLSDTTIIEIDDESI